MTGWGKVTDGELSALAQLDVSRGVECLAHTARVRLDMDGRHVAFSQCRDALWLAPRMAAELVSLRVQLVEEQSRWLRAVGGLGSQENAAWVVRRALDLPSAQAAWDALAAAKET